jgi:hypothetical protein
MLLLLLSFLIAEIWVAALQVDRQELEAVEQPRQVGVDPNSSILRRRCL